MSFNTSSSQAQVALMVSQKRELDDEMAAARTKALRLEQEIQELKQQVWDHAVVLSARTAGLLPVY